MGYPRELIGQTAIIDAADRELNAVEYADVYVDTDALTHPIKIEAWIGTDRTGRIRLTVTQADQLARLLDCAIKDHEEVIARIRPAATAER
jgi:hypothetical protein